MTADTTENSAVVGANDYVGVRGLQVITEGDGRS